MSSPLTLENSVILACMRAEPEVRHIQELVERGPDWQEIARKSEQWGVGPLLYINLRQAVPSGHVPAPVAERLRHLYHREAIHGTARRELLGAALARFAEAGVPVIVLKSAALATLTYRSPALRAMKKIDLLVHRHDRTRVDTVLLNLRDVLGAPVGGKAGLSLLDVRHDLFDPSKADRIPAAVRLPIEDLWDRARSVEIASVPTLVLSHEDLLLHLAMHLTMAARFVGHVRTLCDIAEVSRRHGDAIDWSRLVAQACAYDLAKPLYHSLRLARELVGATVPSRTLAELRASFGQLPLEDRFIASSARRALLDVDEYASLPATVTLGVRLLMTPRARDGVTLACRHLARTCRGRLRRLVHGRDPGPPRDASRDNSERASRTPQTAAQPTAQPVRSIHTRAELAVTYDQNQRDGLGSQLLRIYGLYAFSRALGIKYVHTPLGEVDYQGLMPLLEGRTDPDFVTRANAFFSLPSDDFDLDGCERVVAEYPDEKRVEHFRQYAAAIGRPVLLRAHGPYAYTDPHPEAYLALRAITPYREFRPEGPIRVCIHVRRGDAFMTQDPRLLSNAYFLRMCGTIVNALRQHDVSFVVRLHTEIPPRPYTVHPGFPRLFVHLNGPATLDPAAHALEDFKALPNLTLVLNVGAREALDDFATADVLILSRSCLGYVGGLLNPHGLVIATPDLPWPRNFHAALPDWLVADERGDLDATQVAARIASQLDRRG
jgi:hypothetical protein